ncbi:hypothetical protein DWW77_11805 [Ruminococcus sp. AF17-12]|nr:hypothetical protein DWW77_11805 [Ruminococcus sp. AF17-12]
MPVSSALQFFQTLNTYSRLYPNKQAEVAQQLENLINGTTVPDTIIKKEKELLRTLLIQFCKLEFIVLSKPICFFFSKYGNITISIWIVIMKIATKLF